MRDIDWESVPGHGNGGQPIFLKFGAEVCLDKILWFPKFFCYLTFCSKVTGGSGFSDPDYLKSPHQHGNFKDLSLLTQKGSGNLNSICC